MNGAYRIESVDGGLVVGPNHPGTPRSKINAHWIIGPFPDPDLWTFEPSPDASGSYYIVNAEIDLVIDITAPVGPGSGLQLAERKRDPSQLWRFDAVPNQPGCYYITSAAMGLVMGLGAAVAPEVAVNAVERTPEANQWWRLLTKAGAPAQPPTVQPGEREGVGPA